MSSASISQSSYPALSLDKDGNTVVLITKQQWDSTLVRVAEATELQKRNRELRNSIIYYEKAKSSSDSLNAVNKDIIESQSQVISTQRDMLEVAETKSFKTEYDKCSVDLDNANAVISKKNRIIKVLATGALISFTAGASYIVINETR